MRGRRMGGGVVLRVGTVVVVIWWPLGIEWESVGLEGW
jgi:hypothetical protein